jgi:hypothetical protein
MSGHFPSRTLHTLSLISMLDRDLVTAGALLHVAYLCAWIAVGVVVAYIATLLISARSSRVVRANQVWADSGRVPESCPKAGLFGGP